MQVICKHPCLYDDCKYHPIAAPIDGTETELRDLHGTEACVNEDIKHGSDGGREG